MENQFEKASPMNHQINIITENIQIATETAEVSDYGQFLTNLDVSYSKSGFYLRIGPNSQREGWLLILSVNRTQVLDLLKTIVPILISQNVTFKIPKNRDVATSIQNGNMGIQYIGKVILIQCKNDEHVAEVAKILLNKTESFQGPESCTDRHLGSILYTRLGAIDTLSKINNKGFSEEYILSSTGEVKKNNLLDPFDMPKSVIWPFCDIAPQKLIKKELILQGKYKPIKILKEDIKGYVKKALWLKKIYQIKWCIIKEGKKMMSVDDYGRDMRNRLKWQYEIHKKLALIIPIPEAYALFEENGDAYFVIQYINGQSLDDIVNRLFNGRIWAQLSSQNQNILLTYFLKIIEIVSIIHKQGYIHRDITPVNFMVDKHGKIWSIDLELTYTQIYDNNNPPFALGTSGFMSPEQENKYPPTIKQDIYAIGALLLSMFTGQLPAKYSTNDPNILKEQLRYFINGEAIVDLITDCFNIDPELRPTINSIKTTIEQYKNSNLSANYKSSLSFTSKILQEIINAAIFGLASDIYLNKNNLWLSNDKKRDDVTYHLNSGAINIGFRQGLSGILYSLSCAHIVGISIDPCYEMYKESLRFVQEETINNHDSMSAGLYEGQAGIAFSITQCLECGLISKINNTIGLIIDNISSEKTTDPGLIKGLSGYGIALLKTSSHFDNFGIIQRLKTVVENILLSQTKDGSWVTSKNANSKNLKITGLGHGVAGIITFLSGYAQKYEPNNTQIQISITKACNWLKKQAKLSKGNILWYVDDELKDHSRNFIHGIAGIALGFLKAYEFLPNEDYKNIAEQILHTYPDIWNCRDITYANGSVGINEIYLEAARILNSEEWYEKAYQGLNFLLHQFVWRNDGSIYWLPDIAPYPSSGFMSGTSGILHFLLRCYKPQALEHPFLPF
jgi:serine/threonine protein kinase